MRWRRMGILRVYKKHTDIKVSLNQPLPDTSARTARFLWSLCLSEAYLNACINSRGGSTFTKEQFNYNRIHRDTQFNRLLAWLLIQQPLRDKRCLWTHLSIPLNRSSPESAYVILENACFPGTSGGVPLPKLWDSANHTYFIKGSTSLTKLSSNEWWFGPFFA